MGKIRRSFDVSFKIRVSEAIESGAKTIADICKQYQLQRQIVERWMSQYVSGELQGKGKMVSREAELEREVEKLRSKIGEMTMVIDALKKAERYKDPTKSEGSWMITSKTFEQSGKPAKPLALPPPATITVRKDRH
jgi:transposase-like protein